MVQKVIKVMIMVIDGDKILVMVLWIILTQTEQLRVLLLKIPHYGVIGKIMELVNITQIQLQVKMMVFIVLIVI